MNIELDSKAVRALISTHFEGAVLLHGQAAGQSRSASPALRADRLPRTHMCSCMAPCCKEAVTIARPGFLDHATGR